MWCYLLRRFFPVMAFITARPILRSRPPLVVGMRVLRATLPLRAEMPRARFREKDSPGIRTIMLGVFLFCSYKKLYHSPFAELPPSLGLLLRLGC